MPAHEVILLLVVGLISILGQVVLLRELSVAFYGIELIYTLAMGVWLLCTAAGALISRRNLEPSPEQVRSLLVAFALLLPLDVVFIRAIRQVYSGVPGAYLPFDRQMLALTMALLPVGLLAGLAFQRAAGLFLNRGGSLPKAYAVECAGGLAGGLLSTTLLMLGVQTFTTALLCGLTAAGPCMIAPRRASAATSCRRSRWYRGLSFAVAGILVAGILRSADLDRLTTSWNHPDLVSVTDTPYGRLAVSARDSQVVVFENDALAFETEGTTAEEFVHLAALQHPRPERVLLLGGGVEGTVREILKHSPRSVDYVELNPAMLSVLPPLLPSDLRRSLGSATVRTIQADPRSYMLGCGEYDLILVAMAEPISGQANRFYTREFFQQCSARLAQGGIFAFRIRSSENFWTPQLTHQMVSIYRALKAALPSILVLPGATNVVIAARQPLISDPALLAARLAERRIQGRMVSAPYVKYLLLNDRFEQIARTLAAGSAPANTDIRPVCYRYAIIIWLSKFFPRLAAVDAAELFPRGAAAVLLWSIVAIGMAALLLWARRHDRIRRLALMAAVGMIGMILETVLLLYFQVKKGVLYQDIGLLLMSFMAGLALGAVVVERWTDSWSGGLRISRLTGGALMLAAVLLSGWIGWRIRSGAGASLAEVAVLQAAAGMLVSGVFAYASACGVPDQKRVIGPLYAADLAGGCLGSLTASMLLVPYGGLDTSALLMVPVSLVCLALL
jgi:spermidine synthase